MRSGARWRADRGPTQRGVQPVRNLARAVRQNRGRRDGAAPQAIYSRRFQDRPPDRRPQDQIYALERADERAALARLAKARAVTDIISIEGAATRLYWDRWRGTPLAFRDNAPAAWKTFQTRVAPTPRNRHRSERTTAIFSARHARHPIGAQLNYAYKVALAQITRAIIGHDLDPVYGFLHGDRRGRLSFSYDVLELFRARIDAVIFKFVRLRKFERADFAEFEGGVVGSRTGWRATLRRFCCGQSPSPRLN